MNSIMKNISSAEWRSLLSQDNNAVVLDVRTPGECAQGILPNAKQLNVMDPMGFDKGLKNLDKSKNYYVYCRSGGRSGQACALMAREGFGTLYNLAGGIMSWDGEIV